MEPTPTQLRYIKRNARRAARDVLAAYAEHSRIPVNPIAIARSMGLRVFESPLPGDTWGMILGNLGGTAHIYFDENLPPVRARYTCAHELEDLINAYKDKVGDADGKKALRTQFIHTSITAARIVDGTLTFDELIEDEEIATGKLYLAYNKTGVAILAYQVMGKDVRPMIRQIKASRSRTVDAIETDLPD